MKKTLILILLGLGLNSLANAQTLSLQDCVRLGLENSADSRNAALDVQAARLQKQEAFAQYFPSLSATGLAFYSANPLVDISMTDVLGTTDMAYQLAERLEQMAAPYGINTSYKALEHGYTAALTLTQPLYAGGRIVTGNRLAALGEQAAQTKSRLQTRNTREEITKMFYQVVALQEKKVSLDAAGRLLDSLIADVNVAVSTGLAVPSDLAAVQIKESELKAGKSRLDAGLKLAKMNLFNNIGVEYNPFRDDISLDGTLQDIMTPEQAYADETELVYSLDESRLLQMQVEAKELERRMTLGENLPSVMLGASYGYSRMLGSPTGNGLVYAMIQIPISDWGKKAGKLERQRIEVQKARNQQDFLKRQLVLQLRQLYVELSCAYDQMQIARESEQLSKQRLEQMQSSYNAGMCTLTELLQSESAFLSSQDASIDATLDYLCALESYLLRQK